MYNAHMSKREQSFRWALMDIQTTGPHIKHDKITEIAVIIITENGIEKTWHKHFISKSEPLLISGTEGSNCFFFEHIAEELILLLQGAVLVAHNGRFEFGFLKNAFKQAGITYQSSVLCSIKLFKALYPRKKNFILNELAVEFGIQPQGSDRALTNLSLLYQILQYIFLEHSLLNVLSTAKIIYKNSSLPSKLKTSINAFPETPGVYLFFSSQSKLPLYIGKSINLRQRILSHFQSDYVTGKEFILSQQVEKVEIIPTSGELSALLLESKLIKENMPIYNRRLRRKKEVVGFKLIIQDAYLSVSICRGKEDGETNTTLLGAFRSMHAAKVALQEIVKEFDLCPKLCGMEMAQKACFSFQLKRCKGACIGVEAVDSYNRRVEDAFKKYHLKTWPFKNAIAIKEYCTIQKVTKFLIFNQWRYLGSVEQEEELKTWYLLKENNITHYDTYKILQSFLKHKKPIVINL